MLYYAILCYIIMVSYSNIKEIGLNKLSLELFSERAFENNLTTPNIRTFKIPLKGNLILLNH